MRINLERNGTNKYILLRSWKSNQKDRPIFFRFTESSSPFESEDSKFYPAFSKWSGMLDTVIEHRKQNLHY